MTDQIGAVTIKLAPLIISRDELSNSKAYEGEAQPTPKKAFLPIIQNASAQVGLVSLPKHLVEMVSKTYRSQAVAELQKCSDLLASDIPQIKLATAREQGNKIGVAAILRRPKNNILIGAAYFKEQIKKFEDLSWALAAYNGGRGNALRWKKTNTITFAETREYITQVLDNLKIYKRIYEG